MTDAAGGSADSGDPRGGGQPHGKRTANQHSEVRTNMTRIEYEDPAAETAWKDFCHDTDRQADVLEAAGITLTQALTDFRSNPQHPNTAIVAKHMIEDGATFHEINHVLAVPQKEATTIRDLNDQLDQRDATLKTRDAAISRLQNKDKRKDEIIERLENELRAMKRQLTEVNSRTFNKARTQRSGRRIATVANALDGGWLTALRPKQDD